MPEILDRARAQVFADGVGLDEEGVLQVLQLPDEDLLPIVDDAALVAALNCTRVGADPPTRAELDAARDSTGGR